LEDKGIHLRILVTGIDGGELLPGDAPGFEGMARRASAIERYRSELSLLLGNGIFIPPGPDTQIRRKIISRVMSLMGYDGVNVTAPLIPLKSVICTNLTINGEKLRGYLIKRVQAAGKELKIAVMGLTSEAVLPNLEIYHGEVDVLPADDVLISSLKELRPKSDFIVLLFQGSFEEAKMLSKKVKGYGMVIYSDPSGRLSSLVKNKDLLGGPILIDGGTDPNQVTVVDLKFLRKKLAEVEVRRIRISRRLPDSPVISSLISLYRQIVTEENLTPEGRFRVGMRIYKGASAYVGSDKCRECHQYEFAIWNESKHSKSYEALKGSGSERVCLRCHSTGVDLSAGLELKRKGEVSVGCEGCHGPGSLHVSDPDRNKYESIFSERICQECHTDERFDFYKAYQRIRH